MLINEDMQSTIIDREVNDDDKREFIASLKSSLPVASSLLDMYSNPTSNDILQSDIVLPNELDCKIAHNDVSIGIGTKTSNFDSRELSNIDTNDEDIDTRKNQYEDNASHEEYNNYQENLSNMSVRQFLDTEVVPVLLPAMMKLATLRPSDPIEFLADYFKSVAQNRKSGNDDS